MNHHSKLPSVGLAEPALHLFFFTHSEEIRMLLINIHKAGDVLQNGFPGSSLLLLAESSEG